MSPIAEPAPGVIEPVRPPPHRTRRLWVLIGLAVVAVVLVLIAGHFLFEGVVVTQQVRPGFRTELGADVATAIALGATAVVGALIFAQQSRNRVGWLALATALLGTLQAWWVVDYAAFGLDIRAGAVPVPLLPLWLGQLSPFLIFGLYLVVLPLIFPDGRLLDRRWGWALVAYAGSLVLAIPTLFDPVNLSRYGVANPYSNSALAGYDLNGPSTLLFIALFIGSAIAALVSLVKRYQRASADVQH